MAVIASFSVCFGEFVWDFRVQFANTEAAMYLLRTKVTTIQRISFEKSKIVLALVSTN